MKDVSIIIVTYNSERVIKACLESIVRETKRHSFEIIVSDNDSKDKTAEIVKTCSAARLILNGANLGFAKANNIALKQAQGKYILFLNPDTAVQNGAIDVLIDHLEVDNDVHMATGRLSYPDGRLQLNIKRNPTLISQLVLLLKLTRLPYTWKSFEHFLNRAFDYSQPGAVEQIMGACIFVRREEVQSIGGFDEDYFIWFEDLEICLQYQKRGWKIMYYPDAQFMHYESESFKRQPPLKNQRWFLRSLRTYARKHWFPLGYLLVCLLTPVALSLVLIGLGLGARPKTHSELR